MDYDSKKYFAVIKFSIIALILSMHGMVNAKDGDFKNVQILKEDSIKYNVTTLLANTKLPFENFETKAIELIKKSYWIKFIYDKANKQKTYYLDLPFILYQKLDLYFKVNDSLHHFESGVATDFKNRNLFSPNLYLELPTTNQPTICYLHVEGFYSYSFFFNEQEDSKVIENEIKNSAIIYFFIGISVVSIVFSLIFYAFLRSKVYLYYAFFSLMLIFSRLTHSGYIYHFLSDIYAVDSLKSIYNLYSLCYAGINIALILYFHEYLKFEKRSKKYYLLIYVILSFRIISLIIQVNFTNEILNNTVNSYFIDLLIQIFFSIVCIRTSKKHFEPSMIALASLGIIIIGNIIFIFNDLGIFNALNLNYNIFLNLAGIEVIIFALSIGYRNFYLKKEHDVAINLVIENIKESERLKDDLNKELEIKVAQRTQEVEDMNALLKTHNIQLKSEVVVANEALIFQKDLNFNEFKNTFPNDDRCYSYLYQLKWKPNEPIRCKKCGYEKHSEGGNYTLRCGKCSHVESVINGTLFQGLRFSILKAFYITYFATTSKQNSTTVEALSNELELRPATLWTFKQKVLALMEANKSKKKHKDGWTHLIEYSIK